MSMPRFVLCVALLAVIWSPIAVLAYRVWQAGPIN